MVPLKINYRISGMLNIDFISRKTSDFSFRFWVTWILLISSPAFTFASTDPILEAQKFVEHSPALAIHWYSQIAPSDSRFKLAVEELMKLHYRESDWPRFFGYAHYYRKHWSIRERTKVQLLEALALLRHCQNEILERLSDEFQNNYPAWKEDLKQIRALSKTRFKEKPAAPNEVRAFQKHWTTGASLWSSDSKIIEKTNPSLIRIGVTNRCSF